MSLVVTLAPTQPSACALDRLTPRMTGICAIDLTDLTRRAVSNMSIQIDAAGHTASASGSLPALSASAMSSEPWYLTVQVALRVLQNSWTIGSRTVVLRAGQNGELRARPRAGAERQRQEQAGEPQRLCACAGSCRRLGQR